MSLLADSDVVDQLSWEQWHQRERRRLDREHNVITSLRQLTGWRILGLERWKPGVVRFTAIREMGNGADLQRGFAKDEVFAQVQLPP